MENNNEKNWIVGISIESYVKILVKNTETMEEANKKALRKINQYTGNVKINSLRITNTAPVEETWSFLYEPVNEHENIPTKEKAKNILTEIKNKAAYAILQCKKNCRLKFRNYQEVKENIDFDNYNLIYAASTDDELKGKSNTTPEILENIYCRFNMNHPDEFRGHSLSVSDIVAIKTENEITFYYVDNIGFEKLEQETIQLPPV